MKLRVVVADDERDFLNAFAMLLAQDFEVVAMAPNGKSALEFIAEAKPDIAVLDLQMPDLNGIEVIRKLANGSNHISVIICSVIRDPDIIEAALEQGASGYVFKDRIATDLVPAIKSAANGQVFVSMQ